MDISVVLIALVTLLAGLAVGWLWRGQRTNGAGAQQARQDVALARQEVDRARGQAEQSQARAGEAERHAAALAARLEAEQRAAGEREEAMVRHATEREQAAARSEAQLRETFQALSAEALKNNNDAFVAMAEQRLAAVRQAADGDLTQRQQAIEGMVSPLKETLTRVQDQLLTVEKNRAGSYSELLTQIGTMRQTSDQLRTETAQLVNALRAPHVRGRWGELQLERAVEAAGMTEHLDYVTQESSTTEDGTLRPDMVVHLAGGKNVVVDSKVAFNGYLEAMEARDEARRNDRLRAHARHLRSHIDQLAAKSYWERFTPSPEFVVCFVPADAFLDAALREDPTLLEHAFERNVVVATPSTLIALLRTVAYTWRQEALAENAAEVHRLGRELYTRLSTVGDHLDRLGRSLTSSVGAYNKTVSSLEGRVLVTARKMQDLKLVDAREQLTTPRQVEETTRTTQAPELTTQRVVSIAGKAAAHQADPGQATLLDPSGTGD